MSTEDIHLVDAVVRAAKAAQDEAARWTQQRADEVVAAIGWYCHQQDVARTIAIRTVSETGLGSVTDLLEVHHRRLLGVLSDLHGERTVGVVYESPRRGLRVLAKPVGVIAVLSPATAPGPAVIGNVLPMLKTRNAVVFSPNPRAQHTVEFTVEVIRRALADVGAPVDLVQCLPEVSRQRGVELMRACDKAVTIGGVGIVRRGNESGTPAIGAGVGNPTVIVDETADLVDAVARVYGGASHNHGISCSSESNVLVHEASRREFEDGLTALGAHLCDLRETAALRRLLWPDERALNREVIGKPAAFLADAAGVRVTGEPTLLVMPCSDPLVDDPMLREKLSPVLTLASYRDFGEAVETVVTLLDRCGRGHSCGLHTTRAERVALLAGRVPSCRVVVNQSTSTNSGAFDSGVPFTATLPAGSWGGSSVSTNVTWREFVNYTTVSHPIPWSVPDEDEVFGPYLHAARVTD
jgi:sulfoacetaldehyde dehydrogenase